jgi:hypothetical protein
VRIAIRIPKEDRPAFGPVAHALTGAIVGGQFIGGITVDDAPDGSGDGFGFIDLTPKANVRVPKGFRVVPQFLHDQLPNPKPGQGEA